MTPGSRILVVEDDPQIRRFLRTSLAAEGFEVHESEDGRSGLASAASRQPSLVVLDLGLPDMDGVDVVREIRAWSTVPVIVLSARTQESEKVKALDAGADDYLTKPFGVPELLARIRAHLRRSLPSGDGGEPLLRLGPVVVDFAARTVHRDGEAVHLTATEFRLLAVLAKNAGRVLTHRHLLHEVWGPHAGDRAHYLRIYMGNLRQKLESDPTQPRHLLTETGVGYRLVV